MKKMRIKNKGNLLDCQARVNRCIETVDGLEVAHVNMSTGEVTYSKGDCIDEALLREAFAKEGLDLEDAE